jgi:hypothetical protein
MALKYYSNVELTQSVNLIQAPTQFVSDLIFKNRNTHSKEVIAFEELTQAAKLAKFAGLRDSANIVNKEGNKIRYFSTPRIAEKVAIDAEDFELAGNIISNLNPEMYRQNVIAKAQLQLKNRILRKREEMACKALKGKWSEGGNDPFEIDYGFTDDFRPTLAGNYKWGGTTASIMSDFEDWKVKILRTTGLPADTCIMSPSALKEFRKDTAVMKEFNNLNFKVGQVDFTKKDSFGYYVGTYSGVDIYQYSAVYKDDSGTEQNFIPDNTVIMLASQAEFSFEFGAIKQVNQTYKTEYFSKMWEENDPSTLWIMAESRPLPIVSRAGSVVYATVK